MSAQVDMLSQSIDHPRVARNDPATSRIAADRLERSGVLGEHIRIAAAVVAGNPGKTSAELAATDTRLDRAEFARRLPEAEREGLVRRGDSRKCAATGSACITWWPASSPIDAPVVAMTFTRPSKGADFAVSDCGRYRIEWARNDEGKAFYNCYCIAEGKRKHIHGSFDAEEARNACRAHAAKRSAQT